jgi:hypothetical protein
MFNIEGITSGSYGKSKTDPDHIAENTSFKGLGLSEAAHKAILKRMPLLYGKVIDRNLSGKRWN